jgi:ABC-type cobalamin/Fe3+-siderophores transport system ATPase subunit
MEAEAKAPILEWREVTARESEGGHLCGPVSLVVREGQGAIFLAQEAAASRAFLYASAGFWLPESGRLLWQGRPLPSKSDLPAQSRFYRDLALVHRPAQLLSDNSLYQCLAMDLAYHGRIVGEEAERRIWEVIAKLGLSREARLSVQKLSERARRRALFALALAKEPKIILMERPAHFLDKDFGSVWECILDESKSRGQAFLVFDRGMSGYREGDFSQAVSL